MLSFSIEVEGPATDRHCELFCGVAPNPVNAPYERFRLKQLHGAAETLLRAFQATGGERLEAVAVGPIQFAKWEKGGYKGARKSIQNGLTL